MHTIDYILKDIKPISLNDNIKKIKALFEEISSSHLPIVDNNKYYGTVTNQDIDFSEFDDKKLKEIKNQIQLFYVTETMNWFEVLQFFAINNTNLMPVLDSNKKYWLL